MRTPSSLEQSIFEEFDESTPIVINTKRIVRDGALIGTFGRDKWDLAVMTPTRTRKSTVCNFENVPCRFKVTVKKSVWVLINYGKPTHSVDRGNTNTKKWITAPSIVSFLDSVRRFLIFIAAETPEVSALSGIVSDSIDVYLENIARRKRKTSLNADYSHIRLLHDLTATLDEVERLAKPSWIEDDVLIPSKGAQEITTRPMPRDVLTPMLLWSVSFVESFSKDILAAREELAEYTSSSLKEYSPIRAPEARLAIEAWKSQFSNEIPFTHITAKGIALSYMCFKLNSKIQYVRGGLDRVLEEFPTLTVSDKCGCPMPTPVSGYIHGKCWKPRGLDFYELTWLSIDLQTACLFLLGLHSAVRPNELLSLEAETVHDDGTRHSVTERVEAPDGQVRHLLHGRTFKGQNGIDGMALADGVARTWAITELAAAAVDVLILLNGSDGRLLRPLTRIKTTGAIQSMTTDTANNGLRAFVRRCGLLAEELQLPDEYRFPTDSDEYMTLRVLRRTSEVFTQQEVGGVLAGAHQAGHRVRDPYDTRVTEGYGALSGQSRIGWETSDLTARALGRLVIDTRSGSVGGPAADRAVGVAHLAATELELIDPANLMTPVLSKEWRRIAKTVGQSVYEVPLAAGTHAYCIFHLPWSACTKEGEIPDVANCKITCPNKALTKDSIKGLEVRKAELEEFRDKKGTTSEEGIRAGNLIATYDQQISDSGL